VTATLLALQALTNLSLAPAGPGLPHGWTLQRVKGAAAPTFAVTGEHALRIEADGAAAFASYRLRSPLRPRAGTLSWQWRTTTPLRDAALRLRARDDAPARVFLVFADGRMLFYSWGARESRGEHFLSWTGANRGVLVLEGADDADGSWHMERRDPFADYRLVFNGAPKAIVAAGVSADTDQLRGRDGRGERADVGGAMTSPPHPRLAAMLRDAQFWVPVAVLLLGLLVLQWIR